VRVGDATLQAKTIVLATHDLAPLSRIADRCVVFNEDHRLAAEGSPQDVLADRDLLLQVNLIHEHSTIYEHSTLPRPPQRPAGAVRDAGR